MDGCPVWVHLPRGLVEMRKRRRSTSGTRKPEVSSFQPALKAGKHYALFMLDLDGTVTSWNAGAEHVTGYAAKEVIGQHVSLFYVAGDRAASAPELTLKKALAEDYAEEDGERYHKDAGTFWAHSVTALMRDPNGQPLAYAQILYDLTERHEKEQHLRQSEDQFRALVQSVDEYAIYMLDPLGNVTTWNSGAEKLKQYSAAEIIGKHFGCFYTTEDVAAGKPQRNLDEAQRKGHITDHGIRIRKDGSTFQAEVVLSALRDSTGELRGFSKVTRDITDQIRSREIEAEKIAAEQANKAKDEFLAALSHELRTPLTPALAAASYLADNVSKIPSEFIEDVDTIRRNIQLQARLIDDLLDLTRVTRGKIELHFARVDAHQVLRDALDISTGGIGEKPLKVSIELEAKEHHIWADPVRIQQVFWNLINNAVKFTGAGGRITLRTSNDGRDHFVFEVTDTGIGIELQRQSSLFTAFEQGERGITRQFGGLGLGLAISKNLIDLHHGAITVESRGRSFGATFKVVLDLIKSEVGPGGAVAERPNVSLKPLRILLVEDHADTRRILGRLLQHFGHEIAIADCSKRAFEILSEQDFDVILSDIGLPDGTGYDIVSWVKARRPMTAVALTGFGTEDDIQRSRNAGFDFHLIKPVDVHELRTVLSQVVS